MGDAGRYRDRSAGRCHRCVPAQQRTGLHPDGCCHDRDYRAEFCGGAAAAIADGQHFISHYGTGAADHWLGAVLETGGDAGAGAGTAADCLYCPHHPGQHDRSAAFPYIRTARAKGMPGHIILLRHALRGALLPVVSYLGPAVAAVSPARWWWKKSSAFPDSAPTSSTVH
ncbi:MAG: hypothetical protein R3E95_05455 [Thiolinea sp.]